MVKLVSMSFFFFCLNWFFCNKQVEYITLWATDAAYVTSSHVQTLPSRIELEAPRHPLSVGATHMIGGMVVGLQ
jgi:hypothetical protein